MTTQEKIMYNAGGYREKFAMKNGVKKEYTANGHKLYKFTYSSNIEYQDANGATYDATEKAWIN